MGRKESNCKGKAIVFKMTYRELKERVKFKLSIDRLNKCHLQENGAIKIPHDLDDFRFEAVDHSLLGKIWFCLGCKGIIFRGNKS
jgi:hypothetical protein